MILAIDPIPDAVYCTNDFMTLGMMRAIHDARLNCPATSRLLPSMISYGRVPSARSLRPSRSPRLPWANMRYGYLSNAWASTARVTA